MAYYKLTQTIVDKFIEVFEVAVVFRRERHPILGPLFSRGSIRRICREVGISHTTFYRWLREYRALVAKDKKHHKGQERTLISFGRAVESMLSDSGDSGRSETSIPSFDDLFSFGDVLDQDVLQTEDTSDSLDADENDEVSAFEALTDELTGGVRLVEFDLKYSRKDV